MYRVKCYFRCLVIAIICFSSSNCASIVHGSHQSLLFSSFPSNAEIYLNEELKGKTPATIILKRNVDYKVRIQLPGYLPYKIWLTRKVDGWVFGNIIFGGLIGLVIDAASGSMYKLTPEQIQAQLNRGDGTFLNKDDKIYIAVVMHVDPAWEKIGCLEKLEN